MQKQIFKNKKVLVSSVSVTLIAAVVFTMLSDHRTPPKKSVHKIQYTEKTEKQGFLRQALLAVDSEMESCYNDYLRREPLRHRRLCGRSMGG